MNRNNIAEQAVDFILTRKMEELADLTRVKIARELSVNANDLAHKFKNHQHITLRKFILREKLNRAAFLLEKKQELTINDLAAKLGFLKLEHFDKEFMRYFAAKPTQYRSMKTRTI